MMKSRNVCHFGVFMLLAALFRATDVLCHDTKDNQCLSKIGPAPEFTLTEQDGKRLALKELRVKCSPSRSFLQAAPTPARCLPQRWRGFRIDQALRSSEPRAREQSAQSFSRKAC